MRAARSRSHARLADGILDLDIDRLRRDLRRIRARGTADSAKTEFTSGGGQPWRAELSLHSGTLQQSPRLMILFRHKTDPGVPQRYTLAPPGTSKIPSEAVEELSDDDLRELLATSVKV